MLEDERCNPDYVLLIHTKQQLASWPFHRFKGPSRQSADALEHLYAVYVMQKHLQDGTSEFSPCKEYLPNLKRKRMQKQQQWSGPSFSSRDELTSMCEALFFSEAVPGDKLLGAAPLSDNSTATGTTHSIALNVEKREQLLQQGYVIMQSGIPAPTDAGWFQALKEDVEALFGSRHYVSLVNRQRKKTSKRGMLLFEGEDTYQGTRTKSKMPQKLQKVKKTVAKWLDKIPTVFKQLGLVDKPRSVLPGCLICVGEEGCGVQDFHTDFCPRNVRDMANNKEALPMSLIGSLTPTGSQVLIKTKDTLVTKTIELKFGDFLLFGGAVVHAGAGYDSFNLRCFSHVEHKELCPYSTDHSFWEACEPNNNVRM